MPTERSAASTDCPACVDSTCTHGDGCVLDAAFDTELAVPCQEPERSALVDGEGSAAKPYAYRLFEVPGVKEALWLLLGNGLDVVGKTTWLAVRLDEGRTPEEIFADALAQIDGMVAT